MASYDVKLPSHPWNEIVLLQKDNQSRHWEVCHGAFVEATYTNIMYVKFYSKLF